MQSIRIESLAVAILLFSATGVSSMSRSFTTWDDPSMILILIFVSVLLALRSRIVLATPLIYLLIAHITLCALQFLWYGSFHPKHLALYPLSFLICYSYLKALREGFFLIYEKQVVYLAGVATIIWLLDVVSAGTVRTSLAGTFFLQPYSEIIESYVIVYTIVNENVVSVLPRNSGFAWEPGAFAVFCGFALMINLMRSNFQKLNVGTFVLVSAIITAQSTTGYLILIVCLFVRIVHAKGAIAAVLRVPIFLAVVLSIFSLPFMEEKLVALWDENLDQLAYAGAMEWNRDRPVAAQRFLSFRIDFHDFMQNPLLGYGGRDEESFLRKDALNVISISGLGKLLAKFGILGFIFFTLSTVLSSVQFRNVARSNGRFLLASIIFITAASYSIVEHPLLMCFWLYWFFLYSNEFSTKQ